MASPPVLYHFYIKSCGMFIPPQLRHCFHRNRNDMLLFEVCYWAMPILMAAAVAAVLLYFVVKAMLNVKVGGRFQDKLRTVPINGCYGRRLGLLERWYVAHSRAGINTGFAVALEMSIMVSVDDMKGILMNVSKRFPWLRARLRRDGVEGIDSRTRLDNENSTTNDGVWGDDFYVQVDATTDEKHTFGFREMSSSALLLDIVQEEARTLWHDEDPSKPLWRATLVRLNKTTKSSCTLILSFHHLVTDGVGAMAVIRAVMEEQQKYKKTSCLQTTTIEDLQLPPPLEDVANTAPSLRHLLVPILLDRFPVLTPYLKPPFWNGSTEHDEVAMLKTDTMILRQPQMLCLNIVPKSDLPCVERYCRQQSGRLSMNTILVAALTKAIAKVFLQGGLQKEKAGRTKLCFSISCAADERRRRAAKVPPTALGSYLSGPLVYMDVGLDCTLYKLGRIFQSKLHCGLLTSIMDIGMTTFIQDDWMDFARRQCREIPHGIKYSLDVSNLGMQHDSETTTMAKNLWFSQGQCGTAAAIQVSIIGGPQGYNAVMSAFPNTLSKTELCSIADEWRQEIIALH